MKKSRITWAVFLLASALIVYLCVQRDRTKLKKYDLPKRRTAALAASKILSLAIKAYVDDTHSIPPLDGIRRRLHHDNVEGWNGPYLQSPEEIFDPWGSAFVVKINNEKIQVISKGPDGILGTEDDIQAEELIRLK